MKKAAVLDQVTHAATHPISTAAYVLGIARGIGAGVIRTASDLFGRGAHDTHDSHDHEPPASPEPLRPVPAPHAEAAPQVAPEPPKESFATEPTAVTRASAHGGRGDDAEIDDWRGDAELEIDPSAEPAAGSVVEALERNDRPGEDQVDHAAVKAVLTESERLRSSD